MIFFWSEKFVSATKFNLPVLATNSEHGAFFLGGINFFWVECTHFGGFQLQSNPNFMTNFVVHLPFRSKMEFFGKFGKNGGFLGKNVMFTKKFSDFFLNDIIDGPHLWGGHFVFGGFGGW